MEKGSCVVTRLEETSPSDPQLHSHISVQRTDAKCLVKRK